MKRLMVTGALALSLGAPGFAAAAEAPAIQAPAPIVFFDIAGPDAAKLRAFYDGVFGWRIGSSNLIGPDSTGSLAGTLRQDPAQKILYLGVPDIAAALRSVAAGGGTVIQPRFAVPGVAVLGLFADPAGNPMGLVEMKDGKPVVPEPDKPAP